MFVYMIAFVQGRINGLDDASVGQVISISFLILNAVAAILPATVLEPLSRRIGTVATMTLCTGIMGVGYFLILGVANSVTTLYLLMAVLGVGWAGIVSLPFAIMSRKANPVKMGQFMGLFNLSIVLPQLFVSLAIGLLVSRMDDQSQVFWVSGIALLLSALAWSQTRDSEGH
jgi:MFS family permease